MQTTNLLTLGSFHRILPRGTTLAYKRGVDCTPLPQGTLRCV